VVESRRWVEVRGGENAAEGAEGRTAYGVQRTAYRRQRAECHGRGGGVEGHRGVEGLT
jgi:hypothetical protein